MNTERPDAVRDEEAGFPGNRSLRRGVDILRAFRPGADLLGNGELAERTGLAPATVSRLTQTLVKAGMLEHDSSRRAYRLAPSVLSLAHAMRSGSPVLLRLAPLMRERAERFKVNVGLACADQDEMVYLESIRYNRKASLRSVVAGQRVPIEKTSLGRAYLAALADARRNAIITRIRARKGANWDEALQSEIAAAVDSVRLLGYCVASWQPQVVAVAAPLALPGHTIYVMNVSVSNRFLEAEVVRELSEVLLDLVAEATESMSQDF